MGYSLSDDDFKYKMVTARADAYDQIKLLNAVDLALGEYCFNKVRTCSHFIIVDYIKTSCNGGMIDVISHILSFFKVIMYAII